MDSPDRPGFLVSSMAERIRTQVSNFRLVPPEALSQWLPGLSVPPNWHAAPFALTAAKPARVLMRNSGEESGGWIGCEVINLFRFSGKATKDLVDEGADCTLRDLGVAAPITYRLTMPPESGIVTTRSRGTTAIGVRLWAQVTNYLVTSGGDNGLIEHTLLIRAPARDRLKAEVSLLSNTLRSSLMTSVRVEAVQHDARVQSTTPATKSPKPDHLA